MKTILLLISISTILFSGCMHTMMMGSHGESQTQTIVVQEKEVTVGEIKAGATFPPLELEKEGIVTVRLSNSKTKLPIEKGMLIANFTLQHDGEMNHESTMQMNNEIPGKENKSGEYTFSFTPSQAGNYAVSVKISSIQGRTLEQPILIETTQEIVGGDHSEHGGGMSGSGGSSSMYII